MYRTFPEISSIKYQKYDISNIQQARLPVLNEKRKFEQRGENPYIYTPYNGESRVKYAVARRGGSSGLSRLKRSDRSRRGLDF